jgi:WD40 repeat protein
MLLDSNLPKQFWTEAVLTAVCLNNRCPTRALPDNTVPAEKWYGTKPNYRKLKVFRCIAYIRKPKIQVNDKFDSRSKKCLMLGYADNGYRLWSLDEKKIIVACDVIFDENKSLTRLNNNSEFYMEDHFKNNVF